MPGVRPPTNNAPTGQGLEKEELDGGQRNTSSGSDSHLQFKGPSLGLHSVVWKNQIEISLHFEFLVFDSSFLYNLDLIYFEILSQIYYTGAFFLLILHCWKFFNLTILRSMR